VSIYVRIFLVFVYLFIIYTKLITILLSIFMCMYLFC